MSRALCLRYEKSRSTLAGCTSLHVSRLVVCFLGGIGSPQVWEDTFYDTIKKRDILSSNQNIPISTVRFLSFPASPPHRCTAAGSFLVQSSSEHVYLGVKSYNIMCHARLYGGIHFSCSSHFPEQCKIMSNTQTCLKR